MFYINLFVFFSTLIGTNKNPTIVHLRVAISTFNSLLKLKIHATAILNLCTI